MKQIDLNDLNIISAGAGSGKTYTVQTTLSEWLKRYPEKIRPDRILAVTFTNLAASEMQIRIKSALLSSGNMEAAEKVASAQISTIHSFGQGIVQSFAYEVGMSPQIRQLSEAEEKILLQLSLSSHAQIIDILEKLERLGYKGTYDGSEYVTSIQKLQDRVMALINMLRTIGAEKSKAAHYISILTDEITTLYGTVEDEGRLNRALHDAVVKLLDHFPDNMHEHEDNTAAADNAASKNGFAANHKALLQARNIENIETDWQLWVKLQSLRTTKIENDTYKMLAEEVMAAANRLSVHPGPLREAISHIETILQISIDTLEGYNEQKRQSALIDFSDMVHIANRILEEQTNIEEMAASFDCLVIDEFQDTNPIQFALLWKFRQAGLPTLVVGDLKQSIMGFQGADASLFALLIEDKNAVQNKLEANWRSTPALMCWINHMGDGLYGEGYTSLTPMAKYPSTLTPLKILNFTADSWSANGKSGKKSFTRQQYDVVAQQIRHMIEDGETIYDRHTKETRPIRPSDIAVLAPRKVMLSKAATLLRAQGLQVQIEQQGWFDSRIVQIAFQALSYLANPLDKHAALYLLVTELGDMSLQKALDHYLEHKHITHPLLERIDMLRLQSDTYTLSGQLVALIEALQLWQYVTEHEKSTQERANLLKLIDLCNEFESMQHESLNALGIYGRNLNSFLAWLNLNEDDTQPKAKSIDKEAVQLLTWHKSKGLEWPVVFVLGIDEDKKPSLPEITIGYTDDSRDDPLANSYVKFFPRFPDSVINDKFIEAQEPEAEETLTNLLYVTMTRAREQLVLVWPSFKEKKADRFSFMHKLIHECGLSVEDDQVEIEGMEACDAFEAVSVVVDIDEEESTDVVSKPIVYGRVAIKALETAVEAVPALISPSGLADDIVDIDTEAIKTQEYGNAVDLSEIKMDAAELGTILHHAYHALLTDAAFDDRLYAALSDRMPQEVFESLKAQSVAFGEYTKQVLHAQKLYHEVPILAKNEEGSVVSGAVDLLIETAEGYWIIDHKSDTVTDFKAQFVHHYPQLEAYAKYTVLDKPILGVGINWVRYGKLSILDQK